MASPTPAKWVQCGGCGEWHLEREPQSKCACARVDGEAAGGPVIWRSPFTQRWIAARDLPCASSRGIQTFRTQAEAEAWTEARDGDR